jgi:hypothetical protein
MWRKVESRQDSDGQPNKMKECARKRVKSGGTGSGKDWELGGKSFVA